MRTEELVILTGEVDSGKTSWCLSFSKANRGYDGILLRKVYQGGQRIGYDALRICSGQTAPFSRLKGAEPPGWHAAESIGPFSVSQEGETAARRWLLEALGSPARGLLVDELGPLEIRGGGLADAVRAVLRDRCSRGLILVVRRNCLAQVISSFCLPAHRLIEVASACREGK